MEEELLAQRDAAIAVSKELQRELQYHRDVVERTFESRAWTAEKLRLQTEQKMCEMEQNWRWESKMYKRLLYLSCFCGSIGAFCGWLFGLILFILLPHPLVGFLVLLPSMTVGASLGILIAKARIRLDKRNRPKKLVVGTEFDHVMDAQDHQKPTSDKVEHTGRNDEKSALLSVGSWILSKSWKVSRDYYNAITSTEVSMKESDTVKAPMQASRKEKAL